MDNPLTKGGRYTNEGVSLFRIRDAAFTITSNTTIPAPLARRSWSADG
ncbi:MAG: hypothetical protein L0Z50_06075 [Verrucomicrobiales bacterium]|nr:hypothetical protein [Verrucomicrobiales bacterium]